MRKKLLGVSVLVLLLSLMIVPLTGPTDHLEVCLLGL